MAVFGVRHAKIGDPVIWYPDGNTDMEGTPGTVVVAGEHAVDIVCHTANGGHILKQNVWHINDKKLRENEFIRSCGGWDYSPFFKDIFLLQAMLQQIQKNREANTKRRQMRKGDTEEVDVEEEVTVGAEE